MIVRRRWIRNQDHGNAHRRQFGQRRRAGPADGYRGGAERQFHFRQERSHDRFEFARGVGVADFFEIARTGQMQELQIGRLLGKQGQ